MTSIRNEFYSASTPSAHPAARRLLLTGRMRSQRINHPPARHRTDSPA